MHAETSSRFVRSGEQIYDYLHPFKKKTDTHASTRTLSD